MDSTLILIIVAVVVIAAVAFFLIRRASSTSADGEPVAQIPAAPGVTATVEAPSALRGRLGRSRSAISSSLSTLLGAGSLDDEAWEELEDVLIVADVGPATASEVVEAVKVRSPVNGDEARSYLVEELIGVLEGADRSLALDGTPSVVVVVGVNGTGKTTSIAKIANALVDDGHAVVLGAADTFRAAADAQLREWGKRVGVPVVSGEEGADPASVAFESLAKAKRDGADAVIVDTAGRLHSQANLMDELEKVVRVLAREAGKIDEILLVLDGAVGQNGIAQAKAFTDAVGVTGVVITKLDGTPKGGVAIAVEKDLGVPVKLIGVGEGMHDLIPFVPSDFVRALVAE